MEAAPLGPCVAMVAEAKKRAAEQRREEERGEQRRRLQETMDRLKADQADDLSDSDS